MFSWRSSKSLADYLVNHHQLSLREAAASTAENVDKAVQIAPPLFNTYRLGEPMSVRPSSAKGATNTQSVREKIAIIGCAGQFSGAENLAQLWRNLAAEKDCISGFPWQRFSESYQARLRTANFPAYGGFIDNVDQFDAEFFHMSAIEAEYMDPQHRLTLQTLWHALEDSAYTASQLPANTCVFIGVSGNDYTSLLNAHNTAQDSYSATGNSHAMLANRLSYLLDIHGPSEAIDTACSSSLVAIYRAMQQLVQGHSQLAIAGGVNLLLSGDTFESAHMAGMLSPDGRCRTFSRHANGYVRGEGVGLVILKMLADAERDSDYIHGVLLAGAENHGGRANSITSPNSRAQSDLIFQAMQDIDAHSIDYIETHGTGTMLGDPVEIEGLKAAYARLRESGDGTVKKHYCGLGSIKSNIGHLEAAAGVAGLCKILLSFKHQLIPASLHSEDISPYIELRDSPFYIVQKSRQWQRQNGRPRRAGLSSFGFGGANAHLVIEDYINTPINSLADEQSHPPAFFAIVLSAPAEKDLQRVVQSLHALLLQNHQASAISIADIAYTLQVAREPMGQRLAFIVHSLDELIDALADFGLAADDDRDRVFYRGKVAAQPKGGLKTFEADGEMAALIHSHPSTDKKATERILAAWVQGLQFDWREYYSDAEKVKRKRVSLMLYPFEKTRYWIPKSCLANNIATSGDCYEQLVDGILDDSISVEEACQRLESTA